MIPILMNKHDCIAKTPIILHVHLGEVFIVERLIFIRCCDPKAEDELELSPIK